MWVWVWHTARASEGTVWHTIAEASDVLMSVTAYLCVCVRSCAQCTCVCMWEAQHAFAAESEGEGEAEGSEFPIRYIRTCVRARLSALSYVSCWQSRQLASVCLWRKGGRDREPECESVDIWQKGWIKVCVRLIITVEYLVVATHAHGLCVWEREQGRERERRHSLILYCLYIERVLLWSLGDSSCVGGH